MRCAGRTTCLRCLSTCVPRLPMLFIRSLNCSHLLGPDPHFSLPISPLLISSLLQAIDDTAHPLCCIPLLCSSSLLSFSSSTPTSSRAAPPVDIAGAMFMSALTASPFGMCSNRKVERVAGNRLLAFPPSGKVVDPNQWASVRSFCLAVQFVAVRATSG